MTDFILHFLICNLWISAMILILFAIKKILKTRLTSRTQYNLWFLPLCLMAVPFIPVPSVRAFSLFSWFTGFIYETSPGSTAGNAASTLRNGYKKKDSHLQYSFFKISCHHRIDKAMYLSSHSADFRL